MNTKKSHVALVLATILFIASIAAIAYALTPNIPTYGQPGSMTTYGTYLVFTDGVGGFYARNGSTGAVQYASTNASFVIQSAFNAAIAMKPIDQFNNGGPIIQFAAGNYSINWTITIRAALNIMGAGVGMTRFQPTRAGITVFLVQPISTSITILTWQGFKIDHWGVAIAATGINFDISKGGTTYEFKADGIEIRDMSTAGITGRLYGAENWFYRCVLISTVTLIGGSGVPSLYIENSVVSGFTNLIFPFVIFSSNDVYGQVEYTGSATYQVATFTGNIFHTQGGSSTKVLWIPDRASSATTVNEINVVGNIWFDPATTGTTTWVYIGNNNINVRVENNEFSTAGSTGSISWGTPVTGLVIEHNTGWNPRPTSSITAGVSPFTFPLLPYDAVYVITTVGGMTVLTLDGQALFNGAFTIGNQVYVGANHALIATWATTAPVFQILPE